jgi:hypothetical protein
LNGKPIEANVWPARHLTNHFKSLTMDDIDRG